MLSMTMVGTPVRALTRPIRRVWCRASTHAMCAVVSTGLHRARDSGVYVFLLPSARHLMRHLRCE